MISNKERKSKVIAIDVFYSATYHAIDLQSYTGDSVIFYDQAPVRAAIHGRLLVLDGIENAERNVLPTLNNLLENREMALEDGRFLMSTDTLKDSNDSFVSSSRIVSVHPDFRVIALGMITSYFSVQYI